MVTGNGLVVDQGLKKKVTTGMYVWLAGVSKMVLRTNTD